MKKLFIGLTLIMSLFLFFSCNKGKIAEYEKTIETLNSQIALLQEKIDNYEKTDQYYYQSGADEYLIGNYWEAFIWMGRLKVKFPTSPLLRGADKIIEDLKLEINNEPKSTIYKGLLSEPSSHTILASQRPPKSKIKIDSWFYKSEEKK